MIAPDLPVLDDIHVTRSQPVSILNSMCMAVVFWRLDPTSMEFQLDSAEYCQAQHK